MMTWLSEMTDVCSVVRQYAPFKPGSKRSLAERARQLGLDSVLQTLLTTASSACLTSAVNPSVEGQFCVYIHLGKQQWFK